MIAVLKLQCGWNYTEALVLVGDWMGSGIGDRDRCRNFRVSRSFGQPLR